MAGAAARGSNDTVPAEAAAQDGWGALAGLEAGQTIKFTGRRVPSLRA